MKKKWTYGVTMIIALITWVIFIWLHTFTHLTCYGDYKGKFSYIGASIGTLIIAFIEWFTFKPEKGASVFSFLLDMDADELMGEKKVLSEDELDIPEKEAVNSNLLKNSLLCTCIVALIYFLALSIEMWTDAKFFNDSTQIEIGILCINKTLVFDPLVLIVYPLWIQVIFKGMDEECYNWKSIISGTVQIVLLSLFAYLLFMELPNIWLIEFAIIENVLIVAAISKYTWKKIKKKGNIPMSLSYH